MTLEEYISAIEHYWNNISLPDYPITIATCAVISNPKLFIEGSIAQLKNYSSAINKDYVIFPCILRLKLYQYELTKRGILPANDGEVPIICYPQAY
jgi:hypothetical protein